MRLRRNALALSLAVLAGPFAAGCGEKASDTPPAGAPAADPSSPFARKAAESGSGPFTATHILIASKNGRMPEVVRSKTQAKAAALAVMEKLAAGAKLDDLVATYTEDKASVGRAGEKDGQYTFGPNSMVPAFEQAVRETPVGKIFPDPVETEYGYHIIRRDK